MDLSRVGEGVDEKRALLRLHARELLGRVDEQVDTAVGVRDRRQVVPEPVHEGAVRRRHDDDVDITLGRGRSAGVRSEDPRRVRPLRVQEGTERTDETVKLRYTPILCGARASTARRTWDIYTRKRRLNQFTNVRDSALAGSRTACSTASCNRRSGGSCHASHV